MLDFTFEKLEAQETDKLEEQEMKDIDKNENLDFSIINVNSKEGKALLDNFNMKFDYLSSIMKTTCKQQMVSNKQLELTYEMVKNIREEFNEFKKYNSKDALQELIIKYEELKINIDHDVNELKDSLCPEKTVEKCKMFFNKRANFKEFLKNNAKIIWAIVITTAITTLINFIISKF